MAAKIQKNNEKAIIWGRVSTVYQELDAQVNEMTAMAIADGYSFNNLIIKKSKGASAIKQNALYQKEVEELIEILNEDKSVRCVYTWEISRIARVELTFYQLKNYFVENKIQLIVKTPSIHLLDAEGNVDPSQEIILNLMMTLAKQEMELKKKRMMRGLEQAQKQGKWSGGANMLYGYTTDRNNNIIIDNEAAEVVREIFDLYLNQNMSARRIFEYMRDKGVFSDYDIHGTASQTNKITHILKNYSYCGIPSTYKNGKRTSRNIYPAIITKEMVDAAIAKIEIHKHSEKTATKNIYYGKGLLKCETCGYAFVPKRNNVIYRCDGHGHNYSININAVDTCIWSEACSLNDEYMMNAYAKNKEEYAKKIKGNKLTIKARKAELQRETEKQERINDLYIDGAISKEKYQSRMDEISAAKIRIQKEIDRLTNANYQIEQLISSENSQYYDDGFLVVQTMDIHDDVTRKQIIDRMIDYVSVKFIERGHYELRIYNKINYIETSPHFYVIKTIGNKISVNMAYENSRTILDMTQLVEKRFKPL
jgi:DNA invertase Pin-like site-specific DNA recombinase